MYFILFYTLFVVGNSLGCELCRHSSPGFAECTSENVCPFDAQFVIVDCFIRRIQSQVVIKQLLIRGSCGPVTKYKYFCTADDLNVKEIVMLDYTNESLHCPGKDTIVCDFLANEPVCPELTTMPSQQEMVDFNTSLRHNVTDLMTTATTSFSVKTHKSGPFSAFTKRLKQKAQTSIANYNVTSNRVLTHRTKSSTLIQYMTKFTQKRDTLIDTTTIGTTPSHNVTTTIGTTRSRNVTTPIDTIPSHNVTTPIGTIPSHNVTTTIDTTPSHNVTTTIDTTHSQTVTNRSHKHAFPTYIETSSSHSTATDPILTTDGESIYSYVRDAFGLGVTSLVLIAAAFLAWLTRMLLKKFKLRCQNPVRSDVEARGGGKSSRVYRREREGACGDIEELELTEAGYNLRSGKK